MLSADAASESEFVHLKVISVNNLSYLLSYGDLEGGFGESVVEEDLEVTLGQLLTSPDCQFSLIAGDEGSGKTVVLRRILREFDRIPTPSPSQPLRSAFPIYINCAHLISQLLFDASRATAATKKMESEIDPAGLLLRSAMQSWHGFTPQADPSSSTTTSSTTPTTATTASRLLGELLRDSRHPFVLLLDGLDAVPRDLANELLYGLLGYKDTTTTNDETSCASICALQAFGKKLGATFGKRLQRVVACCRVNTLADLMRYPLRPTQVPSVGAATNPSTGSTAAGPAEEAEGEAEAGEGVSSSKQWRILKLDSLCGETEQRLYAKALFDKFGLSALPAAPALLDCLLERKGLVLPTQKQSPLLLFVLLRDILLAQSRDGGGSMPATNLHELLCHLAGSLAKGAADRSRLQLAADADTSKRSILRELLPERKTHNKADEANEASNDEEAIERRKLIGLLAYLIVWWDDNYGKSYHYVQNPLFNGNANAADTPAGAGAVADIFVAQRRVFVEAMGKYHQLRRADLDQPEERRQNGERLLDEVARMLPGVVLQHGVGRTLAFANATLHQFFVADYMLTCMANLEDEVTFAKVVTDVLHPWEAQHKPWHHYMQSGGGRRQQPQQNANASGDEPAAETDSRRTLDGLVATSPSSGPAASVRERGGGEDGGEKKDFLRYFWADERHLTDKWWAEVILFIGFKKGTHWLAEKILALKFPSLKEWFASFKGHNTDPQDLGQLRFSHLLRAKACEGVLKQARASDTGVREPPGALKKKTKWGAAFLEFLDRSESALLHLDYYPVYLQLNHVLGTKVVEAVMTKCIDVFKGQNPVYAIDLMVKFYLGGVINERNINIVINSLLDDDEPRVRKAALNLLWRLTLLNKGNNPIFPPHLARPRPGRTDDATNGRAPAASDSPAAETNNRRRRGSANDKREDPLGFVRVIQLVSARLKDKHALVQLEATNVMKEMAQLSIASLTPVQRTFLFGQLLRDEEIQIRQLVNSAVKMMQTFDVYVWLLRWLGHEDPGLRLLVLIVLGLLANPLLPTKQKFDPSRKAICLVLTGLSQEYKPTSPALGDILRDLSARRKRKTSSGGLLGIGGGGSSSSSDADDLDPLLVPFVTVVFEALGETAARCEDLGMMLDLVKCKPFFLKKLCLVITDRIGPARLRPRLDSLLNCHNQRDETNAVIDFYLKHEVIQLLQAIDRDVGDREQLEARRIADEDAEAALDDKRRVAGVTNRSHSGASSLYSTTKFEVLASWLGQQRPHGESSEPQTPPAATTPNDSETRELRLEMVEAIPGVLHLNDVNALRYLHLLIDLLLTEEDHITVQTLIAKLQDLTYSALTGSRRYSAADAALLERTKVEVENKCFEMMQNRNAYMVLTAIRLVSLLEQSRKGEHRARDSIVVDHECQGDDDEKRTQRHARLRQVIHQTMALLSHREADARTEALDLLRVFVSGIHLDLDDNLLVLCSMLKNRIYFVRATAVAALGAVVQHFFLRPDGLDMLKRVEASVVNVVKTSAEDKAVVESATRTLAFFGSRISDASLNLVGSLLKEPSRLRATVVETIGAAGMKGVPFISGIAELLLVEDNWLRTIAVTQLSKLALLRTIDYEHLHGIAALLRYEEYYVKESAIQILCALGVDALLLFVDDILRIMDDEEDEEEPCVVIMTLYAVSLIFAHYRQNGDRTDPLTVCSNYLSHVLAKLDDNSVPVKKAAIKAIRQYPQMIANNTFALQRLTRFLNTFAEESQVQLQAFILLGEANRLSVFDHLSPLLSLLHCRDTKILMKTITALGNLGAHCIHLIPSAINRTKSHEMRRRLLSLLIKFIGYGNYDVLAPPPPPLLGTGGYGREGERDAAEREATTASATLGSAAGEHPANKDDSIDKLIVKKRKEMEYEEKEIEYLFKNKDSTIKRQAFRMMANYYLYAMAQHLSSSSTATATSSTSLPSASASPTTSAVPAAADAERGLRKKAGDERSAKSPPVMTMTMATAMGATTAATGSGGGAAKKRESSVGREESADDIDFSFGSDDEEGGLGIGGGLGHGDALLSVKYRKFLVAMLKDKNQKSRMEAVLALGQLLYREHREAMLRLLFPSAAFSSVAGAALARPLIPSVAVWRLLSQQWHALIAVPSPPSK